MGGVDMDKQSYTIRFVLPKKDLNVLKKSLKAYKGAKNITADLLGIIESQESRQNER
jgi:hypothetical protein